MPSLAPPGMRLLFWAGGLGSALFACDPDDTERPPPFGGCPGCGPGGGGKSPGPDGQGGGGGAEGEVNVSGRVVVFSDDTFNATTAFSTPALVLAQPSSGSRYVEANYDGSLYELTGAREARGTWMAASPNDTSRYARGITRQDTEDGRADVPAVSRLLVDEVFTSMLSQGVVESDVGPLPDAAQIVVRVVNDDGVGLPEFVVDTTTAEFVSYRQGGQWLPSDGRGTSSDGIAWLGNVPARAFPGGEVEISLRGTSTRLESALVAADAVTVITVVIR